MGVGPDQSISWSHSAHSRSIDLPRDTGGPSREARIGSVSLRN